MDAFFNFSKPKQQNAKLELSSAALNQSFAQLKIICDQSGGIEKYVQALKIKSDLFKEYFNENAIFEITIEKIGAICRFLPTVRRRIYPYLQGEAFQRLKDAIIDLMCAKHDANQVDLRIASFCANFPSDKGHRWVRDFASEILHNSNPQQYPPMQRWIWDIETNSGALREIWHGDVDRISIEVPDNYSTFLSLRAELCLFLKEKGVIEDAIFYYDLLIAQIYAQYVAAQGGTFLRADFSSPEDGEAHLRRLLGLDGGKVKSQKNKE